ncbi:MAG: hypothetical protein HY706_09390 [Candidatus Hydrogenedentes bacterium]|nr:hypothetical protein [Candidatus Hydrogenedentota bacterium]
MSTANGHDVFVLPREAGHIVYAPLVGRVVYANDECVAQLKKYLETGDASVVSPDTIARLGGLEWLHGRTPPIPLPLDRHFHPTSVTLFLTNRCNLRCTYCYAEAGEFEGVEIAPEVYRAAIDLVVRNAQRAGRRPRIALHGGGEPTVAWKTLVGALDKKTCAFV